MERIRILLVEDDPADARLLRETLAGHGRVRHEFVHVASIEEALNRMRRAPVADVVLLDLSLPDTSGLDSLERCLSVRGDIPVVVLTGVDDDLMAQAAVEAGAQDYLVKGSVTGEVMARAVRHAVERHRLQAVLQERVKELRGLYAVSQALDDDTPLADGCARVAGHLVQAMQWPDVCYATVTVGDVLGTAGGRPPGDRSPLTAEILVGGQSRGHIEVGYTERERPFLLPEEQQLIDEVAAQVARWIERRDSREQLVSHMEQLRVMVSQLPGIIWTTDTELRVTSYAGAAVGEVGISDQRYVGVSTVELFESDPSDGTLAQFEAALAGESVVFERCWRGRWWRNYLAPKRDDSGEIVGTVCMTLDITAEMQKAAELETTRRRLQGLFEHASDAMILTDADGTHIDANPAACQLTGYVRDELVGMRPWDLATGDSGESDSDTARVMWSRFVAEGTMAGELRIRRKDGEVVHTDCRAVTDIVPGVHLMTMRDITAHKEAEQALATSEARFRAMAESAQDAIYRVRIVPDIAMEYLNPAATAITGFSRQEWEDSPRLYVERAHPEDVSTLDVDNLEPGETKTLNVRFRHADGHWIWLEDNRTVISEDGRPVAVQGVIRDVTAREQTEQALREALEAQEKAAEDLAATNALKSSFLQAASHELRTPLTAILGYAVTVQHRVSDLAPEQLSSFLGRIADSARELEQLLAELLDIERLSRGSVRLDLKATDLSELIAHTIDSIELSGKRLHLETPSTEAVVDAAKFRRIVANLVANAVKHTPEGTNIWVRCASDLRGVKIEVADDGPGVPPDIRSEIFEPFRQGPQMRDAPSPGTGIGLSLVRQFAALHDGRAWVEEREGGGARFVVSIPYAEPSRRLVTPHQGIQLETADHAQEVSTSGVGAM